VNIQNRILAKATTTQSQSNAIVVSFDFSWYKLLRAKKFRLIIRKRVPKTMKPKWMYCYIKLPKKAICACAEIVSVDNITKTEALMRSENIVLTSNEIQGYFGDLRLIGCYKIGKISFPKKEATIDDLSKQLIYHPPQSFFILSKNAKNLIDKICGF
jgi:hypothetical protein